jgi:Domain of unknown function DUF11
VVGLAAAITTCNVGNLPPGTTRILAISVNVREREPIFNVARVAGAQPDPNLRNNVDSARFNPQRP